MSEHTAYESCFACRGHGHEIGSFGDLVTCHTCHGDCFIRVRDSKGRFATRPLARHDRSEQ